jgi:hypothetical protein
MGWGKTWLRASVKILSGAENTTTPQQIGGCLYFFIERLLEQLFFIENKCNLGLFVRIR